MNVRNLISQFEHISQTYHTYEEPAPKTPKAKKSFFGSTPDLLENKSLSPSPQYKPSETKLEDLEIKIRATKKNIGKDNPVHILFNLLVHLIDIGKIEVEGNFRAKQKKSECFNLLNQCKEEIVKTLPELNVIENKPDDVQNVKIIDDNFAGEEKVADEETPAPKKFVCGTKPPKINIYEDENVENTREFASINSLKQIFSDDQAPPNVVKVPVNIIEEAIPDNKNQEENDINETEDVEEKSIGDSLVFKSIKDLRKAFENKGENVAPPKPKIVVTTKTYKELITTNDSDSSEASTIIASDDDNEEETYKIDPQIEQMSLINEISTEMEYLQTIIETLDVSDALRVETLEENLDEFKYKLTQLENTKDEKIEKKKSNALTIVNFAMETLQKKKLGEEVNTDVFQNIFKMEKDEEARNVDIFEAISTMDDLTQEVDNYKNMIESLDESDVIKIKVLKENIAEVFELFVNFETYSDAALEESKLAGIALLEQFNEKLAAVEKSSTTQFLETLLNEINLYSDLVESSKNAEELDDVRNKILKIQEMLHTFEVKDDDELEIVKNLIQKSEIVLENLTRQTPLEIKEINANTQEDNPICERQVKNETNGIQEAEAQIKAEISKTEEIGSSSSEEENLICVKPAKQEVQEKEEIACSNSQEGNLVCEKPAKAEVQNKTEITAKEETVSNNLPEEILICVKPAKQEIEIKQDISAKEETVSNNAQEENLICIKPAKQEVQKEEIVSRNSQEESFVCIIPAKTEVENKTEISAVEEIVIKESTETDAEIKNSEDADKESNSSSSETTETVSFQLDQVAQTNSSSSASTEQHDEEESSSSSEDDETVKENLITITNPNSIAATDKETNVAIEKNETSTKLDALCAEIAYYKQVAEEIDPQDAVKIDATVKHISGILAQVDKIDTNDYTKKINCMKDITNILKIFGQKKHSIDKNEEISVIKRLWGNVTTTVKTAREDLHKGIDASKLGTILAKLMHLIELVRKEKPNNSEEEEMKKDSLQKLEDTVNAINSDLINA